MARPQAAGGGDGRQIWRATADCPQGGGRGFPPDWGLDVGLLFLTVKNRFVTKC
jgi:hypothetical protein